MKIAIISDIHSNLFALEAVLAHAESMGIKRFWCLGDYLHFNAFPQEIVRTIRKLDVVSIHGNVDEMVLAMKKFDKKKNETEIPEDKLPFQWTYRQLTKKSKDYLKDLPKVKRIKINKNRFLLVHGSPIAIDDPIYIDTSEERLQELAKIAKADFVLCGHTHIPFFREVAGVSFVNPGSVGKPIDGDTRACYAVLNIKKANISIEQYRVEYDVKRALDEMITRQLPDIYIRAIETALSHDKLIEVKPPEEEPSK
jgi:putative phosphoesterase